MDILLKNFQTRPPRLSKRPAIPQQNGRRERALNIHFAMQSFIKGCQQPSRNPITIILPEEIEGELLDLALNALFSEYESENCHVDVNNKERDDSSAESLKNIEFRARLIASKILHDLNLDKISYSTPSSSVESFKSNKKNNAKSMDYTEDNKNNKNTTSPEDTNKNQKKTFTLNELKGLVAEAVAEMRGRRGSSSESSPTSGRLRLNKKRSASHLTSSSSSSFSTSSSLPPEETAVRGCDIVISPPTPQRSQFRDANEETVSNLNLPLTFYPPSSPPPSSQFPSSISPIFNSLSLSTPTSNNQTTLAESRQPTQPPKHQYRSTRDDYFEAHSASVRGSRAENDDRVTLISSVETLLGPPPTSTSPQHQKPGTTSNSFVGLYDGHLGPQAADYVRTQLHINLLRDPRYSSDPLAALREAFLKTDRDLNAKSQEKYLQILHQHQDNNNNNNNDSEATPEPPSVASGTTATTLLLREDGRLLMGHAGDSAVVLSHAGGKPEILSSIHRPGESDERVRIEAAGGAVVSYGCWRVNGVLAVSRSIGDGPLAHLVISEPELREIQLRADDEFVVVASDGLWDVMSHSEVVSFVRKGVGLEDGGKKEMWKEHLKRRKICEDLCLEAMKRQATDNISVAIMFLRIPDDQDPENDRNNINVDNNNSHSENQQHQHHLPVVE
eukprot:TRINITY_DN1743_c0_g1_i2.p1 TRINITY_DN1743_c0_g1~~TRINITY_DN1743_c0_g1_i2.p1  ORF type:complete len:687 (-),score=178.36 TRINITY_DN1743_c0_g1_i2:319-2337(-)